MRSIIVFNFLLIFSISSFAQSEVYVNDTLRVGVRAKPVSGAKTISVVKTGEVLEILDRGDPKYYKVKTPAGRIGWVSRTYVSDEKPAFMRLEALNREIESLNERIQSVENQFDLVQENNLSLEGALSRLKEEKAQLQFELEEAKRSVLVPEEYRYVAWVVGVLALFLLGFLIGVLRMRNQIRRRFGGLGV